jgi:hypothetical protein
MNTFSLQGRNAEGSIRTMKRRVVEPLNQEMRDKFRRLQQWTKSLARSVETAVLEMEHILDVKGKVPRNCPSRHAAAELALRHVEEKLGEVTTAVAEVRRALST